MVSQKEAGLLFLVFMCLVFAFIQPDMGNAAYNAALPADNSRIASAPGMIRENFRALKEDGIANAGFIASLSQEDVYGCPLTGTVVSTNIELLSSGSTKFTLDTSTSTVQFWIVGEALATDSGATANHSFSFMHWQTARVGTSVVFVTTPITVTDGDSTFAALCSVTVAPSTSGKITVTAAGPAGSEWKAYAFKRVVRRKGM